jgi:hypothetical protein
MQNLQMTALITGYVLRFFKLALMIQADEKEDSGSAEDEDATPPEFPELVAQIQEVLNTCEGRVFPKLNCSSPKVCSTHTTSSPL